MSAAAAAAGPAAPAAPVEDQEELDKSAWRSCMGRATPWSHDDVQHAAKMLIRHLPPKSVRALENGTFTGNRLLNTKDDSGKNIIASDIERNTPFLKAALASERYNSCFWFADVLIMADFMFCHNVFKGAAGEHDRKVAALNEGRVWKKLICHLRRLHAQTNFGHQGTSTILMLKRLFAESSRPAKLPARHKDKGGAKGSGANDDHDDDDDDSEYVPDTSDDDSDASSWLSARSTPRGHGLMSVSSSGCKPKGDDTASEPAADKGENNDPARESDAETESDEAEPDDKTDYSNYPIDKGGVLIEAEGAAVVCSSDSDDEECEEADVTGPDTERADAKATKGTADTGHTDAEHTKDTGDAKAADAKHKKPRGTGDARDTLAEKTANSTRNVYEQLGMGALTTRELKSLKKKGHAEASESDEEGDDIDAIARSAAASAADKHGDDDCSSTDVGGDDPPGDERDEPEEVADLCECGDDDESVMSTPIVFSPSPASAEFESCSRYNEHLDRQWQKADIIVEKARQRQAKKRAKDAKAKAKAKGRPPATPMTTGKLPRCWDKLQSSMKENPPLPYAYGDKISKKKPAARTGAAAKPENKGSGKGKSNGKSAKDKSASASKGPKKTVKASASFKVHRPDKKRRAKDDEPEEASMPPTALKVANKWNDWDFDELEVPPAARPIEAILDKLSGTENYTVYSRSGARVNVRLGNKCYRITAVANEWPEVVNYGWKKYGSATKAFEICSAACGFDEPAAPF